MLRRGIFQIALMAAISYNASAASKVITYIDGNNNKFIITQQKTDATIQYFPIKPEESSSGTYNGGEPFKINITLDEHKELMILINTASKDISQQSEDRNMGCGTIIKSTSKIYFLKMDSYDKTMIETKLKTLKDKYMVKNEAPKEDTVIVEGVFVEKNFVSKKGEMKDIKEYYFKPNEPNDTNYKSEYFVKLSEGKVTVDQIKEFMGRLIRARLVVLKGLWDADDNTHQSRFGDYVILFDLID